MSKKTLRELEILHKEKERELQELFDRTSWIFEEEEKEQLPRLKKAIYMPDGIDVLKLRESMEISVDWKKNVNRKSFIPLIIMTVFWNAIIVVIALAMVSSGALASLVMLSIHALVGGGLAYSLLSLFLNKTNIIVDKDGISLRHSPLFSFTKKNIDIQRAAIDQFYVQRYISGTVNGIPSYAYTLICKTTDGKRHVLIKGLNHESLLFLEQEFENYMGIRDQAMEGEADLKDKKEHI